MKPLLIFYPPFPLCCFYCKHYHKYTQSHLLSVGISPRICRQSIKLISLKLIIIKIKNENLPTSCKDCLDTCIFSRNRSMRFIVMYNVSLRKPSLKWTSIIQSNNIARILGVMSFCYFVM